MQTATDEDARRLLDSIHPTCEHRTERGTLTCSTEADWLLRTDCGDSAFFCVGHKEALDAELSTRTTTLRCAGHGGRRVLFDWIPV